jgi:hypothetical protein
MKLGPNDPTPVPPPVANDKKEPEKKADEAQ